MRKWHFSKDDALLPVIFSTLTTEPCLLPTAKVHLLEFQSRCGLHFHLLMMDENFQIFPPLRPSFSYFQDFLDKLSSKRLEKSNLIVWMQKNQLFFCIHLNLSKRSWPHFSQFSQQHVLCYSWLPSTLGFMPNFNQHSANVSWRVIGQFAYLWALKHSNCEQTCLWLPTSLY